MNLPAVSSERTSAKLTCLKPTLLALIVSVAICPNDILR